MATTWKEKLGAAVPEELGREIDNFETEIGLRKQGKIDEKVFAERRLRRGAYGQRYDNGKRNDGTQVRQLNYPSGDVTKGPHTMWDAPGMQRIKIPFGGLTAVQLEVLADLAEEYGDSILHVTTRQDIQIHYVHIDDTPSLFRRLAAAGITTREACGNTVRNVTGCVLAGVCRGETFDVTPYAKACAKFLLGHRDTQNFGRKFKIAFSGCQENACGLAMMHDMGLIAKTRTVDGKDRRGFALYVGGGLGSVPNQAKLFDEFLPEEELLPIAQAMSRVFARMGEKKNRNTARLKFLVNKLGIEEFKRIVLEERKGLAADPEWTAFVKGVPTDVETPLKKAEKLNGRARPEGYDAWAKTNVYAQRQEGYAVVTVTFPLGDFTSKQSRALADIARKYVGDAVRLTVDQNAVLRWVSEADLPALYGDLKKAGLDQPGAGSIVDITACPGTDTCKLGIASSRGLAAELRTRLAAKSVELDQAVRDLKIKISGCFNSCGQHHVCDIGFYGVSRRKGNYTVPHFQVFVGGKWQDNAGAYGLAVIPIPSKRIPEVVDRLSGAYVKERNKNETFHEYVGRVGKSRIRQMLEDLVPLPLHKDDPTFFSDWGDPREYGISDMGVGECAGEVVSPFDFGMQAAEREVFEAQIELDGGNTKTAADKAVHGMLTAAVELVRVDFYDCTDDPAQVLKEFKERFYDTQLFFDPFAGGKFAQYFIQAIESPLTRYDADTVHRLVEEAQLFLEAAHSCATRMAGAGKQL